MKPVSDRAIEARLRRVGVALRRARMDAGLTVFELARALNVNATKVAMYESARSYENRNVSDRTKSPPLRHVVAVALACNVNPSELLPW